MTYIQDDLISIIMPTTGRAMLAQRAIAMVMETTENHKLVFVCVVDKDERTACALVDFLAVCEVPFKLVYHPEYQGLARSWNRGLRCADGGILVFFADDLEPQPGWLDEALRVLYDRLGGYGLVGFNDTHRKGHKEATHYLASRDFVLEYMNGCMGFEHYNFCCNDSEACKRAISTGHYAWAKNSIVKRNLIDDETKRLHFDRQQADEDIAHLHRRMAQGFPNDFEPAILR